MSANSTSSPGPTTERFFPETGQVVRGAFLDFFTRYGLDVCGYPITAESLDQGRSVQFFQRIALEQPEPGMVRLLPIGAELLAAREQLRRLRGEVTAPAPVNLTPLLLAPIALDNRVGRLAVHSTDRYPERALTDIRRLVIHRTGAPADVGPETIAEYHVHRQGWPGIGYHFVVGADGHVWQTNGLITAAYHAREFNATAVGIALAGHFNDPPPNDAQLDATARLCAWLLEGLHLSPEAIQGHRELVRTACPGDGWLQGAAWGRRLRSQVRTLLGFPPEPPGGPPDAAEAAAGVAGPEPATSDADFAI
jgi:hypothetical protein